MRIAGLLGVAVIAVAALGAEPVAAPPGAAAVTTAPAVPATCDAALKAMCATLAAAKTFSFETHAIDEMILASGQKVEFARNQQVSVRRPNGLAAKVRGDREAFEFYYDGKTIAMLNLTHHVFGQIDAPATIDAMLDDLAMKHGFVVPLADLLFADPYQVLTTGLVSGEDLGVGYVFDTKCHHLAFREPMVDWQIWMDEGPNPLPRKIVITSKTAPGGTQYTAYFMKWEIDKDLPAATFEFKAPADAKKVDFAPPATTQPAAALPH